MGRRSTRENKNEYQLSREAAGLTREAAAEAMVFVSDDRIEKIESGRSAPHPDEVQAMARCYRDAALCTHYCASECPIGQEHMKEPEPTDLTRVTLEMLDAVNWLHAEQARLIHIVKDGKITEDEYPVFTEIHKKLSDLSDSIGSYRLWLENEVLAGRLDEETVKEK